MIRHLQQTDIADCMGIAAKGWGPLVGSLAQVDLQEAFGQAPWRPTFYVAERGEVVGFAAYGCSWIGYSVYSLTWVCVDPKHRRQGIASSLVYRCLKDLRPFARTVLLMTRDAMGLYEKFGFRAVSTHPAENGDDGIETLMVLDMKNVRGL